MEFYSSLQRFFTSVCVLSFLGLPAICVVLSRALPTFTTSKSKPRYFEDIDIYLGKDSLEVSIQLSVSDLQLDVGIQRIRHDKDENDRFILLRHSNEQPRQIDLQQTLQSRTLTGNLEAGEQETRTVLANLKSSTNQPIAIYFSPKRQLPGRPRSLIDRQSSETSQAYSYALQDREVELREFLNWFRVQERLDKSKKVLDSLRDVVSEFIPEFTNLQLQETPKLAFVVQKNGKPFEMHQLSDGERSLLALVFDLTRRLAIANPKSSNPIAKGSAIVMIDEIELHLHPTWQRQVLRRLTSTFKNCQFIITTHSPQVIGQVRAEKLRLIYRDNEDKVCAITPHQALGMDSSWILQNIMGSSARDYETEQKLSELFDALNEDKYQQARKLIAELKEDVGDFSDLQEAEALLDRLQLLEEYEED
ncbi:MAG: AAA family ATPase [Pseudanabaena sp. Salubria-1]|nr:AAA family ATPase [Pseudanabaena sp. Salubria-1]